MNKIKYYIYTSQSCPKCEKQKQIWREDKIPFVERNAERMKDPQDEIDQEALIQASMQNMELPVVIEL